MLFMLFLGELQLHLQEMVTYLREEDSLTMVMSTLATMKAKN